MLMTKREHARLVMADTKKLGEQAELITKLTRERDECKATSAKVFAANLTLARELQEVRNRLGKFTGPRQRGPGGRFLPVKSVIDHMLEELERAA